MFALINHHHYSLTEVEGMFPYERDIYVQMLLDHLEEQKEKNEQAARASR